MAEYLINEEGAVVVLVRSWLPKDRADSLFEKLLALPWNQETMMIYGKHIQQPRLTYACGDEGITHSYSSLDLKVATWIPEVKAIKERIETESQVKLNSCLINYYRTGADYIAYHSDREANGENATVATVSLGGSRDFYFKSKKDLSRTIKTTLHSGDAVVMVGTTQKLFTHSIPKRAKAEPRISLTYRWI